MAPSPAPSAGCERRALHVGGAGNLCRIHFTELGHRNVKTVRPKRPYINAGNMLTAPIAFHRPGENHREFFSMYSGTPESPFSLW